MSGTEAEGFAPDPGAELGLFPEPDREPRVSEVLEALGARMREARAQAGLTQEDLAGRLGFTQTAVSYWEAGKRDPGVADLLRVAEALAVPPASLLPGSDPLPADGVVIGWRDAWLAVGALQALARDSEPLAQLADRLADAAGATP
jgi:transcriptional regulator with XRE-family HTH domain